MKVNTKELLLELIELTRKNLNAAENLALRSEKDLNRKPSETSWSALECIEHLNKYGYFYLPEIKNRINSSKFSNSPNFSSNWLGNYFSNSMKYKEKLNTMKTFKSMNPLGSKLQKSCIHIFIEQQKTTLDLLNDAREVSLTKTKTGITLTNWIKLRLGDTFRVLIYHNERHIIQAFKSIDQ